MATGWIYLGVSILAYGMANFFQSMAVSRVSAHTGMSPGLLFRLAAHKTYLLGLGCQFTGAVLAFLARKDLPLFLVQSAVAAGLGVTAVAGVVFLHWRLPAAEIFLLGTLCTGLVGLVLSAERSPSKDLGVGGVVLLGIAALAITGLGFFASKLHGASGSVALGGLAGLAFGAAAVASRPLAGATSFADFVSDPLLYILLAHAVVGQLTLGLAMQRGSTTSAVASMDAAATVPAALIGLLLLGDRIAPGLEWLAGLGFVVTLGSILGLTQFAEPQHGHVPPAPAVAKNPVTAGRSTS